MTSKTIKTNTSVDYVVKAISFFKNEYNKVKISGLTYSYPLGENSNSDFAEGGKDEYKENLDAIQQLKDVGFITNYKITSKDIILGGDCVWDFASCKIDESKITQKDAPPATNAGVQALTKIVHEHTHHFDNSIQEKNIVLNHKYEDKTAGKKSPSAKFPYPVPAGTTWEKIIIQFTTNETVNIQVAGHSHPTGFADMGFADKRTNGRPNQQWGFLLVLAKNGGTLSSSSSEASDNFKKQKQLLSDKLVAYFGIEYDPFAPYTDGYKIKITLIPPTPEHTTSRTKDTGRSEVEEIFSEFDSGE